MLGKWYSKMIHPALSVPQLSHACLVCVMREAVAGVEESTPRINQIRKPRDSSTLPEIHQEISQEKLTARTYINMYQFEFWSNRLFTRQLIIIMYWIVLMFKFLWSIVLACGRNICLTFSMNIPVKIKKLDISYFNFDRFLTVLEMKDPTCCGQNNQLVNWVILEEWLLSEK